MLRSLFKKKGKLNPFDRQKVLFLPTISVLGHFIELLTNNSTSFKTLRNGDSEHLRRPSRVTVVWKEKQFSIYRSFYLYVL